MSRAPISRARYLAFTTITLLVPLLLLALLEGGLRLITNGLPLFVPAPFAGEGHLVANQQVARRYYPRDRFVPAPAAEPFPSARADGSLRVFVLGESSAAGFPLPHNGTFSRVLRDVLADIFPGVQVEVVNLGIAATNSYTLVDFMDEVLAQKPNAVLLYGGHNEYYGALGAGATRGGLAPPAARRFMLRLLRLRTVRVIRDALVALGGSGSAGDGVGAGDPGAATMMEVVAADRQIELGGEVYQAGLDQFASNLAVIAERCRAAGVELFVASQPSNVRTQKPFVADANRQPGGARELFDTAIAALAAGDSVQARELFVRARDEDVIRFRAPSALNDVVREVAGRGVHYVPVAEAFDRESAGMPGSGLFYEHVHPTPRGQLLIAREFFDAMREAGFGGRHARLERLRSWDAYGDGMALTGLDLRVAEHTVATLAARWPFVPADSQFDYRGSYRPVGVVDSLALLVSRGGMPWGAAKLALAQRYEQSGMPDSAVAEYRGLARDAPFAELPHRLLGRALLATGDSAGAVAELERSFQLEPGAFTGALLGRLAVARKDFPAAIQYLEAAVRLAPLDPVTLYSLSLAYGMSGDVQGARSTARRLMALDPSFPGLAEWGRTIGLR